MLSPEDLKQLAQKQISESQLNAQLDRFSQGFEPLRLAAAATTEKGILKPSDSEIQSFIAAYELSDLDVLKFVPASGAASRMFKALFALLDMDESSYLDDELTNKFFSEIKDFAFYDDLKNAFDGSFEEAVQAKDKRVISCLLTDEGLSYGTLPKGLLKFHRYESEVKTPVQEHITEGQVYAQKNGKVKIHFTVSPDHQVKFDEHVSEVLNSISGEASVEITYSTQKGSTDTIAADLANQPFRDDEGNLLFRPAGHGALLENLNQLDADIVFVKNIDNVVPDRIKEETIRYKKALAGILIQYQTKTFDLIKKAQGGQDITQEGSALLEDMGLRGTFSNEEVLRLLNRPIRVCGMVKNEGEPGGGPFWISNNGNETLQIVESAQVNTDDSSQKSIFVEATHFNPVDLVCGLKDAKGTSFDLLAYRDDDTGFITEKSYQGRQLQAMELPGLWNGSMAHWNTIFVEVPLITFNPVKTVMDLLKDNHQ